MQRKFIHLDKPVIHAVAEEGSNVSDLLEPLVECAKESASLMASTRTVSIGETLHDLPQFLLLGARGGGVPIRIGLFAGFDAEQLETTVALSRLLLQLELCPELAQDYAIFAYPIVNLEGFSWSASPLAEFRRRLAQDSNDGDVRFFRNELETWNFDGIISLRSNGLNREMAATVHSEVLAREVLEPALDAATAGRSRLGNPVKVLPDTLTSRFSDYGAGHLLPHPAKTSWPFEIELFAPHCDIDLRVRSLFLAVVEILRRYRRFVAHAPSL